MNANLIKVFGHQKQVVFVALSNDTVVDIAYIRTQSDAIRFGMKHPGVAAFVHADSMEPLPSPPQTEEFPSKLPGCTYYSAPGNTLPWPQGFAEKIVIGGMGSQFATGLGVVETIIGLGFNAIVILRSGEVHQIGSLTRSGRTFIGPDCLNIVPECAGPLVVVDGKYRNYFSGEEVPKDQVRTREGKHYQAYTVEQELALVQICAWLCAKSRGTLRPEGILALSQLTAVESPGASMKDSIQDFRKTVAAKLGV